ncbi:PP2C family protein-serine/threonine phosphatase [Auraticoccus monumenti]|uniref:Serine/threonine protein phosphatase PrpC n=1 Tax=Auraticoccus monumenti TaxID=675864 RepID=A0A1G6ZZ05_9ACTN|nr:protein phosphatase 2C domain-containing protein [Auraticoccus monumenti]SDE07613.1 Serine/threonine protein phosphatase PrpC [Auraticoccus monumenti]
MLQFRSVVRTDVGVRNHNEDSAFAGSSLLMVADGVGGAAAGEIASSSATYVASAAALMEGRRVAAAELLTRALTFANRQIHTDATDRADRHRMATTATAVLSDGLTVALGHVGDSRAYRFRAGRLTQLTRDDSLLQEMLDAGVVRPEDARSYPHRNVITRSLGQDEDVELVITPLELVAGDRLLLCSDGVTDVLEDVQLADALTLDLDAAAERVVAEALALGSRDNITCVVAEVVDREWVRPWGTVAGAGWDPTNLIDAAAVRWGAGSGPGTVLTGR